jgi:hypothetical protein
VKIPPPKPAQVIRYSYLWAVEHDEGKEEGRKDRPVAVVMTLQKEGGDLQVAVVPVTHSVPHADDDAMELAPAVKRLLGLDGERSWVVLTEINVFVWPGPDLWPTGASGEETVLYGYLPASVFRTIRDRLVANIKAGKARHVKRTT